MAALMNCFLLLGIPFTVEVYEPNEGNIPCNAWEKPVSPHFVSKQLKTTATCNKYVVFKLFISYPATFDKDF